jgi:hypothetical protein
MDSGLAVSRQSGMTERGFFRRRQRIIRVLRRSRKGIRREAPDSSKKMPRGLTSPPQWQ